MWLQSLWGSCPVYKITHEEVTELKKFPRIPTMLAPFPVTLRASTVPWSMYSSVIRPRKTQDGSWESPNGEQANGSRYGWWGDLEIHKAAERTRFTQDQARGALSEPHHGEGMTR